MHHFTCADLLDAVGAGGIRVNFVITLLFGLRGFVLLGKLPCFRILEILGFQDRLHPVVVMNETSVKNRGPDLGHHPVVKTKVVLADQRPTQSLFAL